jgi:Rieske 2Fe-2S family protein
MTLDTHSKTRERPMTLSSHDETRGDILEMIRQRRPGWTLEQPFYSDETVFNLEMQEIFPKHWIYVGHVSRIPSQGDYFLYEIGNESVIIIRSDDGQIHAPFNVCRHRGSKICVESTGHVGSLVCPYHQWVYRQDGTLKTARLMPEDFDMSRYGLAQAQVRVLEGFIFICLTNDPPDFDKMADDLRPHWAPHCFANAKICHTDSLDIRANWKVLAENARECYHCNGGHPELCRISVGAAAVGKPWLAEKKQKLNELAQAHWQRLGLSTHRVDHAPETCHQAYRAPFFEDIVTSSLDGQPVAPLMGRLTDREVGIVNTGILPTFWLEACGDYAATYRYIPVAPDVTKVQVDWLVRGDAVEGRDYQTNRVIEMLRIVNDQDFQLCEDTQAGIRSRHYRSGPYADVEQTLEIFVRWYLNRLADGEGASAPGERCDNSSGQA